MSEMKLERERETTDLSESIGVGGHIGQDDEDVLLELVGVVLGGGESESRSNNTLDTESHSRQSRISSSGEGATDVGSLAKLRKRVTRSNEPFSSKSCRKNRAVSMLTPMAAKTMEKLSSCPSWIPLVGAASGFRSVDNLLTNPACRQI